MSKIRVVTHSGKYHADDVFAVATLDILMDPEEIIIIRTRNPKLIEEADYVVDVGQVYDPENKRFDHHQEEGAGVRENGIPYASFGLVWKEYGEKLSGSKDVAELIDKKLVQAIDGPDNGVEVWKESISGVAPYTIYNVMAAFRSTWKEEDIKNDDVFVGMVALAKKILKREIEIASIHIEAVSVVRNVVESDSVLIEYEKPVYAVLYRPDADEWQVLAVNKEKHSFEMRKPLPKEWRGKTDQELQEISKVDDALFCHRSGFMAMAKSKEGAIALAQKALEA